MPLPKPVALTDFKGLYARGEAEIVPKDFLINGLNFDWDEEILHSRSGSELEFTISNILRIFEYKRIGEASRVLVLTTGGTLFDVTVSTTVPILTIPGMVDFSAQTFFNRVYISPHDRVQGMPGEKIYVYDGTAVRQAGGLAPSGVMTASVSASSGNVEAGTHLIAVVFEMSSGYLTKPGPALYAVHVAPGGFAVDLSGVPIGPSGTVKRHFLATKAIPTYDGNQSGYIFYFVPNGTINDNVTTTATLSFYDADLFLTADYLFDQLETIPASLSLVSYAGRMVICGADGEESVVRMSRRGEPESFSSVDGFMIVDPSESRGVNALVEFRDSLYMAKEERWYQTTDNTQEPATWQWISVDKGFGTTVFGIGSVLDSKGSNIEAVVVASKQGLQRFIGVFEDPPLSYNIENLWKRINKNYFDKVQVCIDPLKKKIYISVPLDGATDTSHLLVADYVRGMTFKGIRWSLWQFPSPQVSIMISRDYTQNRFALTYARVDNVYSINDSLKNDAGVMIPTPFIRTYGIGNLNINHFGPLHVHAKGAGNLIITPIGFDDIPGNSLKVIALQMANEIPVPVPNAFVSEQMSLNFKVVSFDHYFRLMAVRVPVQKLYESGPA